MVEVINAVASTPAINEGDFYMGLYITGMFLPYEVTPRQWEQAYEECLQLVDAYDFLDIIVNREKYKEDGLL